MPLAADVVGGAMHVVHLLLCAGDCMSMQFNCISDSDANVCRLPFAACCLLFAVCHTPYAVLNGRKQR